MKLITAVFFKFVFCIGLLVPFQCLFACTTFCLNKNGKIVFGRNYDWATGVGIIHTNLKGLQKTALSTEEGNHLSWTSIYGSVTFNQFGKEFPNGGMNEKGLVVELMWLNESQFPAKDRRPSLSVLQWIQYQLDQAATVDEVIASDKLIRILSTGTPQHYLIADKQGAVATIEFLEGKIVVHRGESLPYAVLANSSYDASITSFKRQAANQDNSLQRFSKACTMVNAYRMNDDTSSIVDYAFNILENVSQGDFTKWSIVYDISNQAIYFKTSENKGVSIIAMSGLLFSCDVPSRSYNLARRAHGNILPYFSPFSASENGRVLRQAFHQSSEWVKIPDTLQF